MSDVLTTIRAAVTITDLVDEDPHCRQCGGLIEVNAARGSWNCRPCNVGGDMFSFVMNQQDVNFKEALEILKKRAQ